jgi:hypothetical protein
MEAFRENRKSSEGKTSLASQADQARLLGRQITALQGSLMKDP